MKRFIGLILFLLFTIHCSLFTAFAGPPSAPCKIQGNAFTVTPDGDFATKGTLIGHAVLTTNLIADGGNINGTVIGATTPAAGTFTSATADSFVLTADSYGLAKPSPFVLAPRNDIPPLEYFASYGVVWNYQGTLLYASGSDYKTIKTLIGNVHTYTIDDDVCFRDVDPDNTYITTAGACDNAHCTAHFGYIKPATSATALARVYADGDGNKVLQVIGPANVEGLIEKVKLSTTVVTTNDKYAYVSGLASWPATAFVGAAETGIFVKPFVGIGILSSSVIAGNNIAIGCAYADGTGTRMTNWYVVYEKGGVFTPHDTGVAYGVDGYKFVELVVEDDDYIAKVNGITIHAESAVIDDIDTWTIPSAGVYMQSGIDVPTTGGTLDIKFLNQFREP